MALDPDVRTLLQSVRLHRELGPHTARILARQGLQTFADIAIRSDRDLLAYRGIGPNTIIRLHRAIDRLLSGQPLLTERPPDDAWDRLATHDPRRDVLIDVHGLEPDQRAALTVVRLEETRLSDDARFVAQLFGCADLLDVARLPPARIASLSPATFSDLRAALIRVLSGAPPAAGTPSDGAADEALTPMGEPIPESRIVPTVLRARLRRVDLCAILDADRVYDAMIADRLTSAYDLAARDPHALAARYGLSAADLTGLARRVIAALGPRAGRVVAKDGEAAWIGKPAQDHHHAVITGDGHPYVPLDALQRRRLRDRAVRPHQAGLTPRLCERAIAGGCRTLADLADVPDNRIPALLEIPAAAVAALQARLISLARYADPASDAEGLDIDVLCQDGFGHDLCTILALAGYPTLGRAARADLAACPGVPGALAPSLKRAIHTRLARGTPRSSNATLLDLDAESLAWLQTQPIAALDAPQLRKGVIHRLRQAGFTDLASLATADPVRIPSFHKIGDRSAAVVAARLRAILAETPLVRGRQTAEAA